MSKVFVKPQSPRPQAFNFRPRVATLPGNSINNGGAQDIPVIQAAPGVNPSYKDIYSDSDKYGFARYTQAMGGSVPLLSRQLQEGATAPGQPIMYSSPVPYAPNPMTPEEIEEYYRRPRRTPVSHPILKKAKACINCVYFLAYERGKDSKHLNLCRYLGISPWNENFTCAGSFCDTYEEKGKEKQDVKALPAPMPKKRRRRTKAEIEADNKKLVLKLDSENKQFVAQEVPIHPSGAVSIEVSHTEDLMAEILNTEIVSEESSVVSQNVSQPIEPEVQKEKPKSETTGWFGTRKNKANENSDVDSRITFGKN